MNILLGITLLMVVVNLLLAAYLNWQTKELLEYFTADLNEIITTCIILQGKNEVDPPDDMEGTE